MTASRTGQSFSNWGGIQGRVEIPVGVLAAAARLAHEHYRQAEAEEFSGDAVADVSGSGLTSCIVAAPNWFPRVEVASLGYAPRFGTGSLLATAGVDSHIDDVGGPTCGIVLFNDGLRFKQGRAVHATTVGEWFIFDDRRLHEVVSSPSTTAYLVWTVALETVR